MQLSQNERIIMNLLWTENRPLSRAEILKGTPGRNWNPASIHLILNSMISKGAIKITDETKKYGRTYEVCFTESDYLLEALREVYPGSADVEIVMTTLQQLIALKCIKAKELDEIQTFIDARKTKCNSKKKN
jgi:predicted transcriptional regulator